MKTLKTFATMFSGGELFGVGAEQAGYKHLWGVEYDDKIASVARLNGFNVITGDVRKTETIEGLPSPDHLHASPPCPNFSVAKTNGGETETDMQLSDAVCNAILTHKPETFSMENVRGYVKSESFKHIIATLSSLGYMIDSQVVDAANFGVPQNRLRLIVRAKRNGLISQFPSPVKWVGWYEAIEDLLDTLPETEFAPWQMERLPQEYRVYTILAGATEAKSKAFIVDGQPTNYGKTVTVRGGDEPMMTVHASQEKKPLRAYSTGRVVKMTVQALGRFQTVPDTYKGLTTKINGNGVPCLLARRIMESLR